MRAVLFEGTPEEFARVEALFRAGGDPTRSLVLPLCRPKAWPELDEERGYQLAKRVLERAPANSVDLALEPHEPRTNKPSPRPIVKTSANAANANRASSVGPSSRQNMFRLPTERHGAHFI